MKARFESKKKAVAPLNKEQSAFVEYCVERDISMLFNALIIDPRNTMLVAPVLVDSSNRKFENIPLFSYILWTGHYAWMDAFIHEDKDQDPSDRFDIYQNLLNQLRDFKKNGVTFSIGDKVYKKQSQYSDKEHIDALKEYVAKHPSLTEKERKDFWIKVVGGKQRMVEKHIALALCHADNTPSHSLSIFKADEKLPKPIWFPLSQSKLGEEYAICLGKVAVACEAPNPDQVTQMIKRLETIEQARNTNLVAIENTLKQLKEEMRTVLVSDLKI